MTVDFTRADSHKHSSFSHGVHRCIGAPLALRIFIEEWLKRVPDFGVNPSDPPARAAGSVHGLERLPLVW